MKKLFTILGVAAMASTIGAYALHGVAGNPLSNHNAEVTEAAEVVPLEDVVAGSMPEFGAPIDLDEYPLGAGYINLIFGGKLMVNEEVAAHNAVELYRDGDKVGECAVIEDNLVYLGEPEPGMETEGDEDDPGMSANVMTVLELDFDNDFSQPGTYAVLIPEGILMYEDGTLVGGGEIDYEVEQNFAPVAYDITPRPFDEGLDNTVDKLTRFTVSVSNLDYSALTVTEGAFMEVYNPNGWYNYLPLEAEQIDATSVRLSLPFGLYVPATYTLSIYSGSLIATQLDGTEVPVQDIIEEYVIGEGDPIAFEDLMLWGDPAPAIFDEVVDLAETDWGLSYPSYVMAGHWAPVDGAQGVITVSKEGAVVASTDYVEVYDDSMYLPDEDDDIDPGFAMSDAMSYVIVYFEDLITEVGSYTVTIPDGLFWVNNSKVLGSEIEYVVIDSETGVESAFGATEVFKVVDLQGRVIMRNASASDVNALAKGLYIINGKVVKK